MEISIADTKITNMNMALSLDVNIPTTVIIAEVIVIITMTIDEAIVIIATTTTIIIITTNTIKVLNNTLTGVHKKERNILIFSQLDTTVHKIITNSKSTATTTKKKRP